jgi:hypothetical protein
LTPNFEKRTHLLTIYPRALTLIAVTSSLFDAYLPETKDKAIVMTVRDFDHLGLRNVMFELVPR